MMTANSTSQLKPQQVSPNQNQKKSKIPLILYIVFTLVSIFGFIYADASQPSNVPKNSTAGLAILVIISISAIFGLVGLILGKIIVFISNRIVKNEPEELKVRKARRITIIGMIILVILGVSFVGLMIIGSVDNEGNKLREEANTFGVKLDSGKVKRINLENEDTVSHKILLDCERDYYLDGSYSNVIWEESSIDLEDSLEYYTYVNSIAKFSLEKDEQSYLYVLINLRATSKRSLLLVIKKPNEIVYKELLERENNFLVLGLAESQNDNKLISVLEYTGDYVGDFPDIDYNLCALGNSYESEDFVIHKYGYTLGD